MFISQIIRSIQAQQAPAPLQDAVENALCALGWTCSALYSAIAQRLSALQRIAAVLKQTGPGITSIV
jgi:hypothetical protein